MKTCIKNLLIIAFLLHASNYMVGCAMQPTKPRVVVKTKKDAYVPLAKKQLDCVFGFLNRDVDIIRANKVCQEIFKTK